MTRGILLTGTFAAALALGGTPVFAQRTNSGDSTGSAVPRDGGGGGSSSSGSSGSSDGGSGSGQSSSSPSSSEPSRGSSVEPSRRDEAQGRGASRGGDRGGDRGGSTGRAVPRGGSSDGGRTGSTSGRTAGGAAATEGDSSTADRGQGRDRDGRPQIGTAVQRRGAGPGLGTGGSTPVYAGYPYGRYYWPGYAFGLGYYYDPLWYDPYYYGGSGYGGSGYGGSGYGYGGGYQGGSGSASYAQGPAGALRLKISPKQAQVYVDGYFVGIVDDFDGVFQKLALEAGGRRIEIKAEGHEPAELDVLITPGETVTYRGDLKRIQ